MSCPQMTEIVIVWNNDITPEEAGFKLNLEWKRPVHFVKTKYNSMDFRYLIPKEIESKLFFSMDDDIAIKCDELVKGFKKWQTYSVGHLGPLLSYDVRTFDHSEEENSFEYRFGINSEFYSLALTGFSWIPRFYLDLYYTNKSETVLKLRSWVQKLNNCDDILLNFVVSYFFPEFLPLRIEGNNLDIQTFPHSQSGSSSHLKNRTACVKEFTKTIGYNPAKYIYRKGADKANKELKSLSKYFIFLKYNELKINFLGEEGENKISLSELINKTEFFTSNKEERDQKVQKDILLRLKLKEMESNLELLEQQNQNYLEENSQLKGINQQLYGRKCEDEVIILEDQLAETEKYLKLTTYGLIFIVFLSIFGAVWICKKQKEPSPIAQKDTELNLE